MAYTPFDPTKPDPATQNGTAIMGSIRANLNAMRDACVMGSFAGFNMAATGGTADQPALLTYSKGTERVKAALTWGTTGGELGNCTVAVYSYSSNSGGSYDTIATCTVTYDGSGYVTATTWS